MSLGSLNIDLNANIIKFQAAFEKAAYIANQNMEAIARAAGKAESAMKSLEGMFEKAGLAMGTLGLVGGAAGLISVAKSSIEGAVELKHLSDQTGASVEALSALKAVSKLVGMDMQDAGAGAAKLSKSMYDAQGGAQKQQDTFKKLGVTYLDSTGKLKPVGDVMLEVGKKFADMTSGAGKTGLAIDLMGKKGATMIPLLQQLAERGNVEGKVTTDLAEKAEHLEITWTKMVGKLNAWKGSALVTVIPILEKVIPILPQLATGVVGFFTITKVLPAAITGVTTAITALGAATSGAGLVGLGMFTKLRTAVIALNTAVLANPFAAIAVAIAAAAAAAYLFQDKLVTIGGTEASIGNWIGGAWDTLKEGILSAWDAISQFFGKVRDAWNSFKDKVSGIGKSVGDTLSSSGKTAMQFAESLFGGYLKVVTNTINSVIGVFVGVGRAIGTVFSFISDNWKSTLENMSNLAKAFGQGVAGVFSGDFSFSAFHTELGRLGASASQLAGNIKADFSKALAADYLGDAAKGIGGALSDIWRKIEANALARKKAEAEAAAKKLGPPGQNTGDSNGQLDPYNQAMLEMQRQAVGIQYVIDNFDRLGGKVRESKAAMAQFDVTLGKFSDTERIAAKLSPLSAAQKQAYIDQATWLDNLEMAQKRLISLKKFDDSVAKLNAETEGLKQSAVQREINAALIALENDGIKKGTEEYLKRQAAMSAAVQNKFKTNFNLGMAEYLEQQQRAIDNEAFMFSLIGKDTVEVQKLTEAHRIDGEVQEAIRRAQKDGVQFTSDEIAAEYAKADAIKKIRMDQIQAVADKQRSGWFGAQEAIRKYGEAANDVGSQVEGALSNAFRGLEDAFVNFTSTGKLSFKGLVNSINADIARIAFKQTFSDLFDGAGSMIKGLFGASASASAGNGAASAASGASAMATLGASVSATTAPLASLAASTTGLNAVTSGLAASFAALNGAVQIAATSMSTMGGASAVGDLGSAAGAFGSFGGFFADGGDPPVGKVSVVGERGPELFVPKAAGTILPNELFSRGSDSDQKPSQTNVINLHINVPSGTSRATADQIAAMSGNAVNRALRRNG